MAAVDARLVNALAILDGVASEGHDAVQSHPDTSTKAIAALEGVIREHKVLTLRRPCPPVARSSWDRNCWMRHALLLL